MAKSFIELTLDRRKKLQDRIERASASLQVNIETVRREANKKLREMRAFTDAKGKLVRNDAAERAIQVQITSLNAFAERERQNATAKLLKMRERAFIESAALSKATVDQGTLGRAKVTTSFSQIFEEAAKVSKNAPVLGLRPSSTLKGTFADQQKRVGSILTNAVVSGESIPDAAKKINDASGIGKRAATRVARTNLNASVGEADRMIYDADPEVFAGYRWDATFDSRTSAICASLHGRFYPLNSVPPGPPAHWNCRSVLLPVFRDENLEEFANKDKRRVRTFKKDGEQAKRSKLIDSDVSFDAWMRQQPSPVTRRITGSDLKNRLFRQNKIRMNDVVGSDLLPRSDKAVVQRALARSSKDKQLLKLAEEFDVRKLSLGDILKRDAREIREVRHTVGAGRGVGKAEVDRLIKLDALKAKKRRDIVSAAAKRQKKINEAKKAEIFDPVPTPPKELLERVERDLKIQLEEAAEALDISADEVRRRVDSHLQELIDEADMYVRVPGEDVESILKDGRFKSQFETGKSRGMFDPDLRKREERNFLGVKDTIDVKDRPIYGYTSSSDSGFVSPDRQFGVGVDPEFFESELDNYGDVAFKLKKDVRKRATITFGDSLDARFSAPSRASAVSVSSAEVETGDEILDFIQAKNIDRISEVYVEAQYHGGISLSDVEEVIFGAEPPSTSLKAALKKKGLKWRIDKTRRNWDR